MSNITYMPFIAVAAIWSCTLAFNSILGRFFKRHAPKSSLVYAINLPARTISWLLAIFASLLIARNYFFKILDLSLLYTGLQIILVIIAHWIAQRFIKRVEYNALNENSLHLDKTTVIALSRLAKIITAIVSTIIFMYTINVDVRALLALGSAGTIVVGIAARDLLANFFGGFMLFIERPFSVGDFIKADDKGIEGTVQHIGWRRIQIITSDCHPLYIPNSLFLSIPIENISRAKHQSINVVINIKGLLAEEINTVLTAIDKMLTLNRDLDKKMPCNASIKHFDSTGFYIRIQCFTKGYNPVYNLKVQQEIFINIAKIIDQINAQHSNDHKIVEFARL